MEKRGPGAPRSHRDRPNRDGFRKPDGKSRDFKHPGSDKPRGAFGAKPGGRVPVGDADLEKRRRAEAADKASMARVTILAGDEVALGCNSTGWPEFQEALRVRLALVDTAKITLPDRISAIWNKNGFKTGAGQPWTARLVEVARAKVAQIKPV
jgi:hypothetical protein